MKKQPNDGHPDQANASDLARLRLHVVDGHGQPIDRVIHADRAAGVVTRLAIEDGNLVLDGDRFAIVTEERVVRFAPIEQVFADEMVSGPETAEPVAAPAGEQPAAEQDVG